MEEKLIAPCGMNCNVCISYQAKHLNLNEQGFSKSYCPGCRPRGKNCAFLKKHCPTIGQGLVRFCFECGEFPCERLKGLDQRYRGKYHLSMIDNLRFIQDQGMEKFLEKEAAKWRCPTCGDVICCHNGLCLRCDLDILRQNKKYRWNEQ
ncbi:MAG: DUF3795 domain-containing protein [bacterium]